MWNFNHPNNIQKSNAVGHKQSRRFLECVDVSSLAQVIKVPIEADALPKPHTYKKEELVGNMKVSSSLGSSDHKMVKCRTLRGGSFAKSLDK
ncbi:hypothetical protein GRJ2_002933200 [Grus japonensis]|uniref:Uncharacterized protein n=1 Tax=Grus japonensis TaxID=30415 RepID=A0ABC9Y550_GRUJA